MIDESIVIFVVAIALAAWIQGTSGFALGIVAMAIMQATGTQTIADGAAVISVLALFNVLLALHRNYSRIDWHLFRRLSIGQVPAIFVGLWLLDYLSATTTSALALIFGLCVVGGSILMVIRPRPIDKLSSPWTAYVAGASGGILGGLFSASGPVTGWYTYRQPIHILTIRATLLAGLAITTSTRTILVGISGGYTQPLLVLVLIGLPVVAVMAWVSRAYRLPITDRTTRRLVFGMLVLIGIWIVYNAVHDLTQEIGY